MSSNWQKDLPISCITELNLITSVVKHCPATQQTTNKSISYEQKPMNDKPEMS
jgi:hypothetical protein